MPIALREVALRENDLGSFAKDPQREVSIGASRVSLQVWHPYGRVCR